MRRLRASVLRNAGLDSQDPFLYAFCWQYRRRGCNWAVVHGTLRNIRRDRVLTPGCAGASRDTALLSESPELQPLPAPVWVTTSIADGPSMPMPMPWGLLSHQRPRSVTGSHGTVRMSPRTLARSSGHAAIYHHSPCPDVGRGGDMNEQAGIDSDSPQVPDFFFNPSSVN